MGIINAMPDYIPDPFAGISTVLSENTPEQIKIVADASLGETYWNIGDCTAPIIISASEELPNFTPPEEGVCAFIIGFDHNSSIEGTGIHFQFGKVNGDNYAFTDNGYDEEKTSGVWFFMKTYDSNVSGWRGSNMRQTVCPAFYNMLPNEWKNVITLCKKYTDNTGNANEAAYSITDTSDYIWLLSEKEQKINATGGAAFSNMYEYQYQEIYAYYQNGNSRAVLNSTGSSYIIWWLRSPHKTDARFICAYSADMYMIPVSNKSYGFRPCFKVGGSDA